MLDSTAKIYSRFKGKRFNDIFAEVDVYHEDDFLLACNSYKLMIPIKSRRIGDLNIFELTLLRLLNLHFWTNEDLVAKTGMEVDFVNFVVLSLKERGYLTEDGVVTEKGKEEIFNNFSAESKNNVEYVTVRIFSLKKTGELLPVICLDEKDIKIGEVDRENKKIKVVVGDSAGTEKTINYKYFNSGKADKNRTKPTKMQVLKLLQDYNRLCRNSKNGIIKVKGNEINVEFAEDVFVHFKAILQRNNISVNIISDGFVSNDSVVVKYFEQEKSLEFFKKLYERANKLKGELQANVDVPKYKYYQIAKFFKDAPQKGSSFQERVEANRVNNKVVRNLFAALEWTLHIYLKQHPLSQALKTVMLSQKANENKRLALQAAQKLGFDLKGLDWNQNDILLSKAYGYKLKSYFDNDDSLPDMDVLLPLCLIQAVNDNGSLWHNVVNEFPEFLNGGTISYRDKSEECSEDEEKNLVTQENGDKELLNEQEQLELDKQVERNKIENVRFNLFLLRNQAKKTRHSGDEAFVSYIRAMGWYKKVGKLIRLLLPDYIDSKQVSAEYTDYTTLMIGDIVSLNKWFSPLDLDKFSYNLKREILSISPNRDNDITFSDTELVLSLSIILEHYFKEKVYLLDINFNARKSMEDAIKNVVEKLDGFSVPIFLNTINSKYYYAALEGRDATLGAYILVWAGHNDEDAYTGENLSEILELIGEVAGLRRHGNSVSISQNKDELLELRNRVLDIIRRMEG